MPYDYSNDNAHWATIIHATAVEFMNGFIELFTTSTNQYGVPSETSLWRGKARIQQLRTPNESSTGYSTRVLRPFRFQVDPNDNPPIINEGVQVRVLDGGCDPDLCAYTYVVHSALNSSHRAVRTIEARSEMKSAYNPSLWVRGVVTDLDESPIGGVIVSLISVVLDENNVPVETVVMVTESVSNGQFWLPVEVNGVFTIRFEHHEYETEDIPLVASGDDLFVELTPDG